MLQTKEPELGDRWAELVRLWAKFEEKEGFKERKKLGTKGRPLFIGEWIRYARSPTWCPSITDVPALETSFQAWWKGLQPEWRMSEDRLTVLDKTDGDWDQLRRPGLNGFLSVIVCLFYWGCKVQGSMKHCVGWASALEDCILVLGHII